MVIILASSAADCGSLATVGQIKDYMVNYICCFVFPLSTCTVLRNKSICWLAPNQNNVFERTYMPTPRLVSVRKYYKAFQSSTMWISSSSSH